MDAGGKITTAHVDFTNTAGQTYAKWDGASRVFYAGGDAFAVSTALAQTRINSTGTFGWSSSVASSGTLDLALAKDALNTLAQRNGTSGQTYNIYNTHTSGTDFERAHIGWNDTADTFVIGTEAAGTGVVRDIAIKGGGDVAIEAGVSALTVRATVDSTAVLDSTGATSIRKAGVRQFDVGGGSGNASYRPLYPASDYDLGLAARRWATTYTQDLDIDQGTLTDDAQALNITSTWNDAADTFTLIKADVTDTASAAGSNLLDLQVGGTSKFNVASSGATTISGSGLVDGDLRVNRIDTRSTGYVTIGYGSASRGTMAVMQTKVSLQSVTALAWSSTTNHLNVSDLILARDAANTLAQRNGVNAQTFNIYNTEDTSLTNYERAHIGWNDTADTFVIGTEAAGTGVVRQIRLAGNVIASTGSTGLYSNFIGVDAGLNNINSNNNGFGDNALRNVTSSSSNTAVGGYALHGAYFANTNTAVGFYAMYNTSGSDNAALGANALFNVQGSNNLGLGSQAGRYQVGGTTPLQVVSDSVFIGTSTKGVKPSTLTGTTGAFKALVNNAAVVIGDTTVNLDDTVLTGIIYQGNTFTVAGDSQVYRVTATATASANAITALAFEPAAKVAWTDNAILTVDPSYDNQLVLGHAAESLGANTVVLGNDSIVTTALKGNVGIATTTPTVALDVSGSIAATGTIKATPTTVAALPAASTAGAGARTFVTDSDNSLSSHHGQTVIGGGSNFVPVYSDGTNWIVG